MRKLKKTDTVARALSRVSVWAGNVASSMLLLLILCVISGVILRYCFHIGSIGLQEFEWHLFASSFLLAMSYALREDAHVRVDVIYGRMNAEERAWVNLMGLLFLFLPFCLVLAWSCREFVYYSFVIGETSPDPGGLPWRFLVKAMLPFSAVTLLVEGVAFFLRETAVLLKRRS